MKNENPENALRTSRRYNYLSALAAFLLWGGWAYYINEYEGFTRGMISGIAQGTASFIITFIMVHLVTWFFKRLQGVMLQLPLSVLATVGMTGMGLAGIHLLAGTPRIINTIAPGLCVGFVFCCYTAYKLRRISRIQPQYHD